MVGGERFAVGAARHILKNTTRDMIVRQVGSNGISGGWIKDIQNSFRDSLLIEF